MRAFRGILWCAAILLAVSVIGLFVLSTQDLRVAKPHFEKALSQQIGHRVSIDGPIRAALIPEGLRLALHDVAVENVDWGLEPNAGKAHRIVLDMRLWPLFDRQVELDRLSISGATVYVERNSAGQVNWGTLTDGSGQPDAVLQMSFTDIELQFYDLSKNGLTRLAIRELSVHPTGDGVSYDGRLQLAGQPVTFTGQARQLANWEDGKAAQIQNDVSIAGYDFDIEGALADPRTHSSELTISGRVPPDSILPGLFGHVDSGQLMTAQLQLSKDQLVLDDLAFGDEEEGPIARVAFLWTPFERPKIDAYVHALNMDVDSSVLGGLSGGNEFSDVAERAAVIAHNWDTHIEIQVGRLELAGTQLDDIHLNLNARDGRVADSSISALMAGGYVEVPFDIWFEPNLSIAARPRARSIRLAHLQAEGGEALPFDGLMSVAADLSAEGNDPAELLSSLEGQTNLLLGDGIISSAANVVSGENAWGEIWQLLSYGRWHGDSPNEDIELSCVVSRFDFVGGLATANGFLVETKQAATTGSGYLDLREGRIDFRLSPRPKDPVLLAAATDLRVAGEIARPVLTPQREPTTDRRGSGGVGTLVLSGGAQSLLPLIEIGHDNENVCTRQISGSVSSASPLSTDGASGGGG